MVEFEVEAVAEAVAGAVHHHHHHQQQQQQQQQDQQQDQQQQLVQPSWRRHWQSCSMDVS